jgi:hypothetical protein
MPNVDVTCELRPARPWQPEAMILPSVLLCRGRDGPARQANAAVLRAIDRSRVVSYTVIHERLHHHPAGSQPKPTP